MKKVFIIVLLLLSISPLAVDAFDGDSVVIVPGIMGSFNWDVLFKQKSSGGTWDFPPLVKNYDNLIAEFEAQGYVLGEDLQIAFYDWRGHNSASAEMYLMPAIDRALTYSETGNIDIVAHSMGGLVTRSYIQSMGGNYRGDIDQFIMLGTPNEGSSDVYTVWQAGYIPENWDKIQWTVLWGYLNYMTAITGETSSFYETIHTYVPSVQELLPTYDYLYDRETGHGIHPSTHHERNLFLQVLNRPDRLMVYEEEGIDVIAVAGTGEMTVGYIATDPQPEEEDELWIDGIPEPLPPERNDDDGDNRVLETSAFLPKAWIPQLTYEDEGWVKRLVRFMFPTAHALNAPPPPSWEQTKIRIASKHGELPTTAISHVMEELGLAPTKIYTAPVEPDNVASFWFASPVEVEVIGPNGNVVNQYVQDIEGAEYSGEDDPQGLKMIAIPNAPEGTYTVRLVGNGVGTYHFASSFISGEENSTHTVEGEITEGQEITYNVTLTNSGDDLVVVTQESSMEESEGIDPMSGGKFLRPRPADDGKDHEGEVLGANTSIFDPTLFIDIIREDGELYLILDILPGI